MRRVIHQARLTRNVADVERALAGVRAELDDPTLSDRYRDQLRGAAEAFEAMLGYSPTMPIGGEPTMASPADDDDEGHRSWRRQAGSELGWIEDIQQNGVPMPPGVTFQSANGEWMALSWLVGSSDEPPSPLVD